MFRLDRRAALAALLVVAVLGGVVEGFLPHTDDGCPTEVHCLVCRSAYSRTAVAVAPTAPLPVVVVVEPAHRDAIPRVGQVDLGTDVSRGPPSFS
jgi:hypothetical protein